MRYSTKLTLITVIVLALSLTLIDFLNRTTFDKKMSALVEQRFLTIGKSMRQNIEYGLGRGYELADLVANARFVDIAGAGYDGLAATIIRDSQGRELFASAPPERRPGVVESAPFIEVDAAWRLQRGHRHSTVEAPLYNDFGQSAGTLSLVYSRAALAREQRSTAAFLWRSLVITWVLGGLFALLCLRAVFRVINRTQGDSARAFSVVDVANREHTRLVLRAR